MLAISHDPAFVLRRSTIEDLNATVTKANGEQGVRRAADVRNREVCAGVDILNFQLSLGVPKAKNLRLTTDENCLRALMPSGLKPENSATSRGLIFHRLKCCHQIAV